MRETQIILSRRERTHIAWLTDEVRLRMRAKTPNKESIELLLNTLMYSDREMWRGWEEPE